MTTNNKAPSGAMWRSKSTGSYFKKTSDGNIFYYRVKTNTWVLSAYTTHIEEFYSNIRRKTIIKITKFKGNLS